MLNHFLKLGFLLMLSASLSVQAQWKEDARPNNNEPDIMRSSPAQREHYAQVQMNIFKDVCIANINEPQVNRENFKDYTVLAPELANIFLNGQKGQAWIVEKSLEDGIHIVSIMDDHYYCAVHTMILDPNKIEELFQTEIIANPVEGTQFNLTSEERKDLGNNVEMHRKNYSFTSDKAEAFSQFGIRVNSQPLKSMPQSSLYMMIDRL